MKPGISYIMRDQVRNQVPSIMAWRPNRPAPHPGAVFAALLVRGLYRLAEALFRGLQGHPQAARTA